MSARTLYSEDGSQVDAGWQRQAESSELADGVQAQIRVIGKPALAAATHHPVFSKHRSRVAAVPGCLNTMSEGVYSADASQDYHR